MPATAWIHRTRAHAHAHGNVREHDGEHERPFLAKLSVFSGVSRCNACSPARVRGTNLPLSPLPFEPCLGILEATSRRCRGRGALKQPSNLRKQPGPSSTPPSLARSCHNFAALRGDFTVTSHQLHANFTPTSHELHATSHARQNFGRSR